MIENMIIIVVLVVACSGVIWWAFTKEDSWERNDQEVMQEEDQKLIDKLEKE